MIGIIPAGGKSTRINGLPKYLLPVSGGYLLERLVNQMPADRVIVAANPVNFDLLCSYAPNGAAVTSIDSVSMSAALLSIGSSHNAISSDEMVLFGMPDTYWTDADTYGRLIETLLDGADVAVAVWRIRDEQRGNLGQCSVVEDNRIESVIDKDSECPLIYAWGAMAWRRSFWAHIHAHDAHLGIALTRAISAGLSVTAVPMSGNYYDCGTPDEYFRCIRETTEVIHATI